MQMKKFKQLHSLRNAKVFLLAGLMGGMTACKDVLEPEIKQNTQQTTSGKYIINNEDQPIYDNFMKHLSDIESARFYVAGTTIRFTLGGDGNVNRFYIFEPDGFDPRSEIISYAPDQEHSADRTYDFAGSNTDAFFGETDWDYRVEGVFPDPHENWGIYDVPQEVYHHYFQALPDTTLARMAYEHLDSINADPGHRDNIYNAILQGHGVWQQEQGVFKFASQGQKIGLRHSDIGTIEEAQRTRNSDEGAATYMGGMAEERSQVPAEPTKFIGKACASICVSRHDTCSYAGHHVDFDEGYRIVSTDSAAATLSHGDIADTLIMPFNGWYKVKVITQHANKHVDISFENYPSNSELDATQWGVHNGSQHSFAVADTTFANGVNMYVGGTGNEDAGVELATTTPLYFGKEEGVTTGLDNVYCAPKRSKSSYDSSTPTEVVTQVFYTDVYNQSGKKKESVISFVFGGVKQNQR